MSKRDQGAALSFYMEQAFLPEAVANYLCLLGWSPKDDREILTIEEILPLCRWENMGHSNAKFDLEKCRWLNAQYLAKLDAPSFDHLAIAWLLAQPTPLPGTDDPRLREVLPLIQPKIKAIPELAEHLPMLFDGAAPIADDARAKLAAPTPPPPPPPPPLAPRLATLRSYLENLSDGSAAAIPAAVAAAAAALAIKPGALLFPLRVLATGQAHGVDLLPALEWLGRTEALPRLRARAAALTATST